MIKAGFNYSVYDDDFSFNDFTSFCTEVQSYKWRVVALRLKNRAAYYQSGLLVPLERITLPLLVFADDDCLIDTVMSRFRKVYKQTNEKLHLAAFIRSNVALTKPRINSLYDCPSLIKLGDYNNLLSSNKNMDILISKVSGGSVYPEVLSEIQPPIKSFSYDIKAEVLSLLKN